MSKVTVMGPGVVAVGPAEVGALDILEYAYAAIKKYGWRNTGKDGPAPEGRGSPTPELAQKYGLSIHDAIGFACVQLSKATGHEVGKATTGTKDWNVTTTDVLGIQDYVNLRDMATRALGFEGGASAREDWKYNDEHTEPEVMALFENAIKREAQ